MGSFSVCELKNEYTPCRHKHRGPCMALAIVMPAYNESECIERVVKSWLGVLDQVSGIIIVVNDGSKDNTGELLDKMAQSEPRLKVVHQKNAGHGAAVRHGYEEALNRGERYIL